MNILPGQPHSEISGSGGVSLINISSDLHYRGNSPKAQPVAASKQSVISLQTAGSQQAEGGDGSSQQISDSSDSGSSQRACSNSCSSGLPAADCPQLPKSPSNLSESSEKEIPAKPAAAPDPNAFGCVIKISCMVLTMNAAIVNVVSFYGLGAFASHVTGTLSKLGMRVEAGAGEDHSADAVGLVLSFIAGSMICGTLIAKNTVDFGLAKYGIVLWINASLLGAACGLSEFDAARYFAAAACGLQNGMATSYCGAVMRTTHMTGASTDIGLLIGRLASLFLRRKFRGLPFDEKDNADISQDTTKLTLLLLLLGSFLVGSFLGAVLFDAVAVEALLIPASINGLAGTCYACWRVGAFCRQPPVLGEELA